MTDGLWWVPSLIVFGTAGFAVAVTMRLAAARRRRLGSARQDALAALQQQAGVILVRTDDLVHSAEDEVAFAAAQFGDAVAKDFAGTLASAREQLREAFRLHQQLGDVSPDSESQRRRWSERVLELCADIDRRIGEHTEGLNARRALDRNAPDRLGELREAMTAIEARLPEIESALELLASRYAPSTFAPVRDAPARARAALAQAEAALEQAELRVSARETSSKHLDDVSQHVLTARQALDGVTRTAARLDSASAELAASIARVRSSVEDAWVRRDATDIPEAVAEISTGIAVAAGALTRAGDRSTPPDPLARLDLLREAEFHLDTALSSARSRKQRIDSAREALRGALFSARSHLDVASTFITENRSRVGPDARTRLAEAERQLTLAEAADDPVDALDIARRVSRLAQDADALARFDTGPRTAPHKR
jgi:chromosome segregation ATPase